MKHSMAIVTSLALVLLAFTQPAYAQQMRKPARIGLLRSSAPPAPNLAAFHKGMRDRGHIEGRTYVLVPGWGKRGRKPEKADVLAKKLVARGVDVIITVGTRPTRAARRAAPTTPIVMASAAAPVKGGLVNSFAAPGGNITGMSSAAVETAVKGMEILKQMVPSIRRIGAFHRGRASKKQVRQPYFKTGDEKAAKALNVEIVAYPVTKKDDFDALFRRVTAAGVDAISVRSTSSFTTAQRKRLVQAALRAKLPSSHTSREEVKLGGLFSIGPNRAELYSRTAAYVDLIIKGAKPADLPVQRPTRYYLTVNLKTAKALGITFPPSILLRADEVIE